MEFNGVPPTVETLLLLFFLHVHKLRTGCFPKYNYSVNYVCQIGAHNYTKKINGNKWSEMETVDASNVSNIC